MFAAAKSRPRFPSESSSAAANRAPGVAQALFFERYDLHGAEYCLIAGGLPGTQFINVLIPVKPP